METLSVKLTITQYKRLESLLEHAGELDIRNAILANRRVALLMDESFMAARKRAVDFLTRRGTPEAGGASVAMLLNHLVNQAEWLEAMGQ